MTSTFDVEQFLSTLAMSYKMTLVIPEEKTSVVIPRTCSSSCSSCSKKTSKAKLTITIQQQVVVKPGTIDATEFFTAIKKAGKRPNIVGVLLYTTEQCQRQDEREAIQAYVGWDKNLAHGTNLDKARTTAKSYLKAEETSSKEYSRSSKPTFNGYVAGMPNVQKRLLNNLIGRISKGLDDLLEHKTIATDNSVPDEIRSYHAKMVMLENERIQQLNNDIQNLGF